MLAFGLIPHERADARIFQAGNYSGFAENSQSPDAPGIPSKGSPSLSYSSVRDSLKKLKLFNARRDSLKADSIKALMLKDSTARLEQFKFVRTPEKSLSVAPEKKYSFYAYPSQLKRSTELDSSGSFVIIKESIGSSEPRPFLKIPLDQYIKLRSEALNRSDWEDLVYKYEYKGAKKDLGDFLSSFTNIEIPLPSSSIFSIFGANKISLRISGAVDIHGAWKSETTEGLTASRLGATRSEPDFKQQVQINVNGVIGDKLSIQADWNTERTFEYENQLKIKYTGYEDEIVQSVEAGNVSLQTSPLVGGSEALFGVKAQFQMGPFSLTALASQKKGEVKEMSVSGGASTQQFSLHAYQYSQNHYFIDAIYADPGLHLFSDYYGSATPQVDQRYQVKEIEVWKTYRSSWSPKERKANAYINLEPRMKSEKYPDDLRNQQKPSIPGTQVIGGRFILLQEGIDYEIHKETGFITFKSQVQDQDAIAVSYRIQGTKSQDSYYGELLQDVSKDTSQALVLKLIKPQNLQPSFKDAWKLQLKNIYPIGGHDIKKDGFKLDIQFIVEGGDPTSDIGGKKLLEAFGLDKTNTDGTSANPDGSFDFKADQTILPGTGEIVFPKLEPFGTDMPNLIDPKYTYQSVYDTTQTGASQDQSKDKFLIKGEYSASATNTYNIGYNVVENSVKVTLNGQLLHNGSDYVVDYNIGQVTIRNDAALVSGADLKISYEQNDLFQLASKTLMGLRGLFDFNKTTKLGFSVLNLSQQTLSDKVRIGEEPLNNTIFGLDFQTGGEIPLMTKALDKLISTKTPSSWTLQGEFAYMDPDPNTMKSTVSSDGGQSIAYIDDFEGSKTTIPVGVSYTSWKDLSFPADSALYINSYRDRFGDFMPDTSKMAYKGQAFWYNILPSDVKVEDIWPDKKVSQKDEQVTALDFYFNPAKRGMYNHYPNLEDPKKMWGGMMKPLSSSANNLAEENMDFIEFWLQAEDIPKDAKMHIDLGQISEDVIPNKRLDTEDKNGNGLLDNGEDTGLDGIPDGDEAGSGPDPAGDNFKYNNTNSTAPENFEKINGTEGNGSLSDIGRYPDTEDLNGNLTIDLVNSYFSYEVPLDSTNKKYIKGGGGKNKGWYLYRIPLREFTSRVGNPSLSIVEAIRFWVSGLDKPVHIRLAEMNFVGSQWQKVLVPGKVDANDTTLVVSTINVEDNPEYSMPPGIHQEQDKTQTDTNTKIYKNEQSLNLVVTKLEDGDKREIVKYLPSSRPLDVLSYKQMKLFVHGDLDNMPGSVSYYNNQSDYGSEMYFRFGSDSSNFYEYRQPLKPGWNEISIPFSELTAIKQRRDSLNILFQIPVSGREDNSIGIKGNPSLTRILYFTFGLENRSDKGQKGMPVSGSVWIDELRVLGADDKEGWAYTVSSSVRLADMLSVSFNRSKTDPYFHRLSDRFGSRSAQENWGVSVDFDVLKLLPFNTQGSNLRMNYARTESAAKPLYLPGTDVKVDNAVAQLVERDKAKGMSDGDAAKAGEELRLQSQTLNVQDILTLSGIKVKIPSEAWYIKNTINDLTLGFNYNKSFGRDPTTERNQRWIWNASANYSLQFSQENYFYPAKIPLFGYLLSLFSDYRNTKVYYTPQSFTSDISTSRTRSFLQSRTLNTDPNIMRDFSAKRSANLSWKISEGALLNLQLNLSVDVSSSLSHLLLNSGGMERNESDIWHDILTGTFFGRDNIYTQNFDLKANPKLPSLFGIDKYFTLTAGYGARFDWTNDFQQLDLGRRAGYSNRINLGLNIRWQDLWAPLLKVEAEAPKAQGQQMQNTSGRNGSAEPHISGRVRRDEQHQSGRIKREEAQASSQTPEAGSNPPVNSEKPITDSLEVQKDSLRIKGAVYHRALLVIRTLSKLVFFDYERITMNFSQTNTRGGSGLKGTGSGFSNFFGIRQQFMDGPSRAFMLGLSNDIGPRAYTSNANLSDNMSQRNSLDFSTSRPLWEGANIDLSWKLGWDYAKTYNLTVNPDGTVAITNSSSTGSLNRSFISFPPKFFLTIFKSGMKRVHELYNKDADDPNTSLSDAFTEGFESMPLLSKLPLLKDFANYVPRPNWRISWSGLETLPIFKNFTKRVSLSHAYQSDYSDAWLTNTDGIQQTQSKTVNTGFAPLIGLNMTFNSLWNGDLTGTVKYDTKSSYSLGMSTRNITETIGNDVALSLSYAKKGFEIPLFGLSLKNDIEFSFSYTMGRNSTIAYVMDDYKDSGTPQDGKIMTTIEPRLKYVMSSRVTLSLFYTRSSTEPEGASHVPATTSNTAGLDVHIAIQ